MDPLDFAIYRFLSPNGEARFWAGRRLIDPTISAREIAGRVGISENGVRARLRGLAERGYLRGTTAIPNPSLFDSRVYAAEVPVQKVNEVERVFRDLAFVEGVLFARDTLDEADRHIRVHFVSENDPTAARRAILLRRLSPTGQLRGPVPYWIPRCEQELSPLDWRTLHAVWSHPDATITELAREMQVSFRTAARRYHQLIESRACWWTHASDSEEFPLALVQLELHDPSERDRVTTWIVDEGTSWMPVADDGLGCEPGSAPTTLSGLVPADAPTVLEKFVRKCGELPAVTEVRRTFPLGSESYPAWFADRIADRIRARS